MTVEQLLAVEEQRRQDAENKNVTLTNANKDLQGKLDDVSAQLADFKKRPTLSPADIEAITKAEASLGIVDANPGLPDSVPAGGGQ